MDVDVESGCGRKYLLDGFIQFLNDVELLQVSFAKLCIAHDLRNDAVRFIDLLLNDPYVFEGLAFALPEGPLK